MWISVPSTFLASAPEQGHSISACSWRALLLAQSAMWRSKLTPAKSWQRAWKKERWTPRLFGRISEPSVAASGVDSWIASLAATRANRSALPVSSSALPIRDISGLLFGATSESSARSSASLKTSPTICSSDSTKSPESYKRWATALRQACLLRRKSAHRINVNGSSSWPTATTADARRGAFLNADLRNKDGKRGAQLVDTAKQWRTPTALSRDPNADYNRPGQAQLDLQVKQWRTPDAYPRGGPQNAAKRKAGGHSINLQDQVHEWQQQPSENWQTPKVSTGAISYSNGDPTRPFLNLEGQAKVWPGKWPTPAARDYRSPNSADHMEAGTGRKHLDQLSNFVALCFRPDLMTLPDGNSCLPTGPLLHPQLNARFVEWLMGWPLGWTDCGCVVTA
jgi:hypothetical protein